MNYPSRVAGRESAFYSSFRYRFSDQELTFMRHAPRAFVQMGNADWFDDHGFRNAMMSPNPSFVLELRVNKLKPELEFLEPAMIELKLTNAASDPTVIDKHLLLEAHEFTLVVKRDGHHAKVWRPFAHHCLKPQKTVLRPGESIYQSLFAAVGPDGWLIAEPGWYTLQASVQIDAGEEIVSAPLRLRVKPSRGYDDEVIAQDFFSDAVGRVLRFDGSRDAALEPANRVLREVVDRCAGRCVAPHAAIALALPLGRSGKVFTGESRQRQIVSVPAKMADARSLLLPMLVDRGDAAAATLGHIDYRDYGVLFAHALAETGDVATAEQVLTSVSGTLQSRQVLPSVVNELKDLAASLGTSDAPRGRPRRRRRRG